MDILRVNNLANVFFFWILIPYLTDLFFIVPSQHTILSCFMSTMCSAGEIINYRLRLNVGFSLSYFRTGMSFVPAWQKPLSFYSDRYTTVPHAKLYEWSDVYFNFVIIFPYFCTDIRENGIYIYQCIWLYDKFSYIYFWFDYMYIQKVNDTLEIATSNGVDGAKIAL